MKPTTRVAIIFTDPNQLKYDENLPDDIQEQLDTYRPHMQIKSAMLAGLVLALQVGLVLILAVVAMSPSATVPLSTPRDPAAAKRIRLFERHYPAVADTYIAQSNPSRNFGTAQALQVAGSNAGSLWTLIRFSLPDLHDYKIKSVDLLLQPDRNWGKSGPSIKVQSCSGPWDEQTAKYDPSLKNGALVGFLATATSDSGDPIRIPLDPNAFLKGGAVALSLMTPTSGANVGFMSREAGKGPRLFFVLEGNQPPPDAPVIPISARPTATDSPDTVGPTSGPKPIEPVPVSLLIWTPAEIATVAWYDASDESTANIIESAGAVEEIKDKSGHGYHLRQTDQKQKPQTGMAANDIGGRNTLSFLSRNWIEARGLNISAPHGFMAISVNVWRNGPYCCQYMIQSRGGDDRFYLRRYAGNNGYQMDCRMAGPGGSPKIKDDMKYTSGDPVISSMVYDEDKATLYLNGGDDKASVDLADAHTLTFNEIRIGWTTNGDTDGAVGEVIFVQGYDKALRQKIEGYLAHK